MTMFHKSLALAGCLVALASTAAKANDNCNCAETQRRIYGLNAVVNYASLSGYERQRINNDVGVANNYLYQADSTWDVNQQSQLCSLANQYVDQEWRRWQPWVSVNGYYYQVTCRQ